LDFALFEYFVDVLQFFFSKYWTNWLYLLSTFKANTGLIGSIYFDPVAILNISRNMWLMKSASLFVYIFLGSSCSLSGFIILAELEYLVDVLQCGT